MNDEEQLRRRLEEMDFPGEPAMASTPFDDARRGRRRLRQRRAAAVTAGLAAVTLVTAGVGYLLPSTGGGTDADLRVAGGPSTPGSTPEATAQQTPEPTGSGGSGSDDSGSDEFVLDFPKTRRLLLDTALEHLDPQGRHLPAESTNLGTSGGGEEREFRVSTKLGWTIPDEDGEGMVFVAVTTPEFTGDGPLGGDATFEGMTGCADASACTERRIPGSPGRAWVAEADPERDFELGVIYERPDGVLVGIGVYSLFGNNSLTPVSETGIDLEDAFAFVTDPDLHVDPHDAAVADPHIRVTQGPSAEE